MTYTKTVATNVRAEASRRGVTSHDIAQILGISSAAVSRRMNEKIEFKISELEKIALLLDVPIEVLVAPAPAFAKAVAS
ncbi:helix-turn-helix domain-containing protein [Rothia nasimurium]|nr:helix-turn-helix transcriptional regulator [Rothia nasimurium]MBF0807319.1 helix-turn-helix domain-containing protein [Rothia nasimurium]